MLAPVMALSGDELDWSRIARGTFTPWLTWCLVAALTSVFIAEQRFPITPGQPGLAPSFPTLVALGGIFRSDIYSTHAWYRLLTGPFLHAGLGHLLANTFTLLICGLYLERLIGAAWLGLIYLVSLLGGAFATLLLQSPAEVSVGASGAIIGVIAAGISIGSIFPKGSIVRGRWLSVVIGLLLITMLPSGAKSGLHTDYAAHIGGALSGSCVGFLLPRLWNGGDRPPHRAVAAWISAAGLLLAIAGFVAVGVRYPTYRVLSEIIPATDLPYT